MFETIVEDIIIENGACALGYKIVYPDGSDQSVADLAFELQEIIETATGVQLEVITDFEHEGTKYQRTDYEILIGETNRDESISVGEALLYRDFAVSYEGTRIAIYGKSIESIEKAINWFAEQLLCNDEPRKPYSYAQHLYGFEN